MKIPKSSMKLAVAVLFVTALASSYAWAAPKYKILHAFVDQNGGWAPYASPTLGRYGELYGTTAAGGVNKWGAVYQLVRQNDGTWEETVLHSFNRDFHDGNSPNGNGVILDNAGNLYGTTLEGGRNNSGIAYELTPNAGGWTEAILYDFCSLLGCEDGGSPDSSLTRDSAGNFYGTGGYVFELSPGPDSWVESVLHKFCPKAEPFGCGDGYDPSPSLIVDPAGNLYGVTVRGGRGQ